MLPSWKSVVKDVSVKTDSIAKETSLNSWKYKAVDRPFINANTHGTVEMLVINPCNVYNWVNPGWATRHLILNFF